MGHCGLEFRTLGSPLVAPSNPSRLQSVSYRSAPVQAVRRLVRVACRKGYPARIKLPAIPGGRRVTSIVDLPGQTQAFSGLDLWSGKVRGKMPKHEQRSVGAIV